MRAGPMPPSRRRCFKPSLAATLLLLALVWFTGHRDTPDSAAPQNMGGTTLRNTQACAQLLGFHRVAMMILTRGDMPHEQLWSDWFADAAGMLPLEHIERGGCGESRVQEIRLKCGIEEGAPVLDRQFMFTVYLHPHKDYQGYQPGSVFHGREIADRIPALWGHPSLMDATKMLLKAALLDPTNQQFIQISEACIPLYPPAVVHQQLVAEPKSRVRACRGIFPVGHGEWPPELAEPGTNMTHKHWRKSSQWFGLIRGHAQIIADDTHFIELFRQHCVARRLVKGKWRVCFSDEHYIPTVLAQRGLEHESDCFGIMVSGNWSSGEGHPHNYAPLEDVWMGRIPVSGAEGKDKGPRRDQCHSEKAIVHAAKGFINVTDLVSSNCSPSYHWDPGLLASQCPLFARKFKADVAEAALAAVRDCRGHFLRSCETRAV